MDEPKWLMHNVRLFAQNNQANRLLLLRLIYDGGSGQKCVIAIKFLNVPEWDESDILEVASYLKEEGLITVDTEHHGLSDPPYLCITHKGIVEVERTIDHPTEATEHFSAGIVQNFHGPVGAVQTGDNSTANATQDL